MKIDNIKMIALAAVISSQLIAGSAYAAHDLEGNSAMPEAAGDGHISWHEFRHDLGAYPGVSASMDHHGVVMLSGHMSSSVDLKKIAQLAAKIRGATDIKNHMMSD